MKNNNTKGNKNNRNRRVEFEKLCGYRILAKGIMRSNDTWTTSLNNNDVIIGSTGKGKTRGYVEPNIRSATHSMVVADTKGLLYRRNSEVLREKGFEVHLIDFIHPENSEHYNLLDAIRRYEVDATDEKGNSVKVTKFFKADLKKLASVLVAGDTRDQFWIDMARNVLVSLIAYVLEVYPREEQNMKTVAELYKVLSDETSNNKPDVSFFDEQETIDPKSFAVSMFHMYRGIIVADKTWAGVLAFVTNALEVFTYDEYDNIFAGESCITFRELGQRKIMYFLNISDNDRSMDHIINVFYTQLFQGIMEEADTNEDGILKVPVRVILDDFASNIIIEDFDKLIPVIRSREIYVSIILQNVEQLEHMYSHPQASTIINNCDTMIYLGGARGQTAKFIADVANKLPESVQDMSGDKVMVYTSGQGAVFAERYVD